jgi:lisH domain-containing protein FOPNL
MASLEDLKNALKETLDSRGVLGDLKARIRAEIFNALDDQESARPRPSDENLVINEMIREYLIYNSYHHTLSVFLPESGQPEHPPFDRTYISRQMRVAEDHKSRSVPLLYGLVKGLRPTSREEYPAPADPIPRRERVTLNEPEPFHISK